MHWNGFKTLNNYTSNVELFLLLSMTVTALNDLYTLNDLHDVVCSEQRWVICTTLNDQYHVEWFVLHWMIWTTLNDL